MNNKGGKDKQAGSGVEEWLPIKPPPALLGNSEKLRQRVNELLDQYRAELQVYGPQELREKRKDLKRYRDNLGQTLEGANPIRPEESVPEALPYGMDIRSWQELERAERVRIYKRQRNTKLETEFQLDVLANVLHRYDRHQRDLATKWGGPSREDALSSEDIELKEKLQTTDGKFDFVQNVMEERSTTDYDELNKILGQEVDRLNIRRKPGLPFKNGESLRSSYHQWRNRQRDS